jgi:hypothetical protein
MRCCGSWNVASELTVKLTPVTDEQAKAITALSQFGTTVVTESSGLAKYVGRVVGTVPKDTVGIVLGDPLRAVRTVLAAKYDEWVSQILERRGVKQTQPVSPSLAIPLLRAAYDESRPELQALWAALLASAMDPQRVGRVRLSFIDTLRRFDPLDALVLKTRNEHQEDLSPNPAAGVAALLTQPESEVQISVDNLKVLNCVVAVHQPNNFHVTNYGRALLVACTP